MIAELMVHALVWVLGADPHALRVTTGHACAMSVVHDDRISAARQ